MSFIGPLFTSHFHFCLQNEKNSMAILVNQYLTNHQPQSSLRNIFWSWKFAQHVSLSRLIRVSETQCSDFKVFLLHRLCTYSMWNCTYSQNQNSRPLKSFKVAINAGLHVLQLLKLISCKIWMAEKFYNLHTVRSKANIPESVHNFWWKFSPTFQFLPDG